MAETFVGRTHCHVAMVILPPAQRLPLSPTKLSFQNQRGESGGGKVRAAEAKSRRILLREAPLLLCACVYVCGCVWVCVGGCVWVGVCVGVGQRTASDSI